jgi:hypothetical protein
MVKRNLSRTQGKNRCFFHTSLSTIDVTQQEREALGATDAHVELNGSGSVVMKTLGLNERKEVNGPIDQTEE